ncbi:MAG: hypothetical protein WBO97_04585 [Tepidiformaceae bacterium]
MPSKHLSLANVLLSGAGIVAVLAVMLARTGSAEAIAPCVPHSATAEESAFLQVLQSWRDGAIQGSHRLMQSAPLNAAAMGYAQFLANTPGAGGHYADGAPGFAWATRAVNCGYPSNLAAGGEGLAVLESSAPVPVDPQAALSIMAGEGGGGVHVPSNVGLPVKCVGVGKAVSPDGKKTAWVTLLFATSGECPSSVSSGGGTAPSSTATPASSTPTITPTPSITPTPTPTATPTPPPVFRSWFSQLSRD